MANALIREFAVTDWRNAEQFYSGILGFTCVYECPEVGSWGVASMMGICRYAIPLERGLLLPIRGIGFPPNGDLAV